jgi:hypothetical protein
MRDFATVFAAIMAWMVIFAILKIIGTAAGWP